MSPALRPAQMVRAELLGCTCSFSGGVRAAGKPKVEEQLWGSSFLLAGKLAVLYSALIATDAGWSFFSVSFFPPPPRESHVYHTAEWLGRPPASSNSQRRKPRNSALPGVCCGRGSAPGENSARGRWGQDRGRASQEDAGTGAASSAAALAVQSICQHAQPPLSPDGPLDD